MEMIRALLLLSIGLVASTGPLAPARSGEPTYQAELVFPLDFRHNHAPGIVQTASGDLLVSWYRGSGERTADDVAIYGATKPANGSRWSTPFVMADVPRFPDCNTCMMLDTQERLWLIWPTILANTWESCLTNFRRADRFQTAGEPKWNWQGLILLRADDLGEQLDRAWERYRDRHPKLAAKMEASPEFHERRKMADDKLFQRLGWQPRCKPTRLASGRIVLPLYTDTFSMSIMALSDDGGQSWTASAPLIGFGNIQPTVLQRQDGTLVAYMRENGPLDRVRVSTSSDQGATWSDVTESELPNPGSGLDAVVLSNGHWVLVYNDSVRGRNRLAISLSDDEGRSWKWTRHLENQEEGSYHYPAVIQGRALNEGPPAPEPNSPHDPYIHVVYSYFVPAGKSMKHVRISESWIRQ